MPLIINGKECPHTDWIIDGRTERLPFGNDVCWWKKGDYQTRSRAEQVDQLVGHWTAGEANVRTIEDDGPRVVYGMKNRMSTTIIGRKLKVSIDFVIGACDKDDPEKEAKIWQCLDIGDTGSIHVGRGEINARSIGIEIVSAGVPGPLNQRRRPEVTRRLLGRNVTMVKFYPGQIKAWNRLVSMLTLNAQDALTPEEIEIALRLGEAGINIPRQYPVDAQGKPLTSRMTLQQLNKFKGVFEHYHLDNTTKIDAGGFCIEACRDMNFRGVKP